MIWFGWVLWHINHFRLFNAKYSLYIYIRYIWFGLLGFYGISTNLGNLMPNTPYIYIYQIYMIWFAWVLWHINHFRLFNAKYSLYIYIYIKYIWFDLVGFYGISTNLGYLMPNTPYTYILDIYDLVCLGLWHINHFRLFNAKYSLYIYIRYIWFGLLGFYGISTNLGYLMPNTPYIYILDIYDLVCLGFMAYQPF